MNKIENHKSQGTMNVPFLPVSPKSQSFKMRPVRIIRFNGSMTMNENQKDQSNIQLVPDCQKYTNDPKLGESSKKSLTNTLNLPCISSSLVAHSLIEMHNSNVTLIKNKSTVDSLLSKDLFNCGIKLRDSNHDGSDTINDINNGCMDNVGLGDDKVGVGDDKVGNLTVTKLKKTNSTMESSSKIKSRMNYSSSNENIVQLDSRAQLDNKADLNYREQLDHRAQMGNRAQLDYRTQLDHKTQMNHTAQLDHIAQMDNRIKMNKISSRRGENDSIDKVDFINTGNDIFENHIKDTIHSNQILIGKNFNRQQFQNQINSNLASPKSNIGSINKHMNENTIEKNGVKVYKTISRFVEAKEKAEIYNDKIVKQYQFDKDNEEEELNFLELCDALQTHL